MPVLFQVYIVLSTLVFILLFAIWDRQTWTNIFCKFLFAFLMVLGCIVSLASAGYIIHSK